MKKDNQSNRRFDRRAPAGQITLGRLALTIFVCVLGLTVAGCQVLAGDRIRPGVSAGGVELAELDPATARVRLAERFGRYEAASLTLQAAGREWRALPSELGIRLDVDETVAQARYVSDIGLPGRIQIVLGGGQPVPLDPVVRVDVDRLAAFLDRLGREINRPAESARLLVDRQGAVQVTPARTGWQLEREAAARVIVDAAVRLEGGPLVLPAREQLPERTEADLAAARDRASRIVGQPLRITDGNSSWTLSQVELAGLVMVRDGAGARPEDIVSLDRERLQARLERLATQIDQPVQQARFEFDKGSLRVVAEGAEGRKVNRSALLQRVLAEVVGGHRVLEVPVEVERPFTPADGPRLGIKELIEETSTDYSGGVAERRHNVELAASRLNGVLVAPGETFSFNRALGSTSLDNGYKVGWGITQGAEGVRTVPAVAGGICQVATTLFQATFWAGYQLEQRNWHLYWIRRYENPPKGLRGLDATVDEEAGVDFQFKNNTGHYLLIQAKTDGKLLTFRLFGTKPGWQVKVDGPVIDRVVPARTAMVEQPDPTMPVGRRLQVEAAIDGFRTRITRTVIEDGQARTLQLTSTYEPARNVTLVGTKPVAVPR